MKYVYVFIRIDIPYVNQTVQACHACLLAGGKFNIGETNLVLLEVSNQQALERAKRYLTRVRIEHVMFYEPDFPKGNTSIVTEPIPDSLRPLFRIFKLRRISLFEFIKSWLKHDSK